MLPTIAWLILAAIHAMPALAFFRPASLQVLYRVGQDNPLFLLMRHRAALFVAVFAACVMAAFVPSARQAAILVTAISMVSFLILYMQAGSPKSLNRIARADLIGLPALAYAALSAFGLAPA